MIHRTTPTDRPSCAAGPLAMALVCLAILAGPAFGQLSEAQKSLLQPTPLVVESLGLSIHRPLESNITQQNTGGNTIISILDSSNPPVWSMSIQPLIVDLPSTPSEQIDVILRRTPAQMRDRTLISNERTNIDGRPSQLCYVNLTSEQGIKVITGWLIVPTSDTLTVYMAFSVQMLAEHAERVRPMLEASFDTVRLRDVSEVHRATQSRLDAGKTLLKSFTPDHLKQLIGVREFYRSYVPGQPGEEDKEIGFVQADVIEAKLGALNPARDEADYDSTEHELGMMVQIHGRFVENAERGIYRDAEMLYWLAWDQSHERWTIRLTRRQGRATMSEAHSGVRAERTMRNPRGSLTVISTGVDGSARTPNTYGVPNVYLSQALRWVLARLLAHMESGPQAFDWFFYDNVESKIVIRSNQWAPAGGESDHWTLTTVPHPSAAPTVSTYTSKGELVRRTAPDGSISVPTTLDDLHRLWTRKGLETGKIR